MKKINKNIILEYGGFVNGWQKLINYIYNLTTKPVNDFLIKNDIDPSDSDYNIKYYLHQIPKEIFLEELNELEFEIDESTLNSCNIYGIKSLPILFNVENGTVAGFVNHYAEINEEKKLINLLIVINPYYLIRMKDRFKDALQHELTHMYEFMMICKKIFLLT